MNTICPFCKAAVSVPDEYWGKRMDCLNCGKSFVVNPGEGAVLSDQSEADPPCTLGDSWAVVLACFAGGLAVCVLLVLLGLFTEIFWFLFAGIFISSLFGLVWAIWILVCLRTIAINSARK